MGAGAIVGRMNFALALAANRLPGITVTPPADPLPHLDFSDTTRATIARGSGAPQMLALALGSPEFQKR